MIPLWISFFSGMPDSRILDKEKIRDAEWHKRICTKESYEMPLHAGSSSSIKHPEICRGTKLGNISYGKPMTEHTPEHSERCLSRTKGKSDTPEPLKFIKAQSDIPEPLTFSKALSDTSLCCITSAMILTFGITTQL